jgi:diaminohydroxyphosphoribosylaminopyrimidine deaminase/5-amino-6-(5-phosphoribosylamino)uracil reductase
MAESSDERFMARALALAERARGRTSPNPLVGCVLVRDGKVIGEGWHRKAGEPHAEALALRAAGEARGATAYVTLEPCNHVGRTPPCTEALIKAGVERVVVAIRDPNPRVNGQGVARLRETGIEVIEGVLEAEARAQNEAFFTVQRGRPWVLYKAAMSADGKTATVSGNSRWITGPAARERVHRWRDQLDAIAVGINTVLHDGPQLTCRTGGGRTPVKVVFDSLARAPVGAKLFEADERGIAARVIVFASKQAAAARIEALESVGAEVEILPADGRGQVSVRAALSRLAEKGLNSLLLEGGGTLAWSFFEARAVDKVALFIAPKLLGGSGASPLSGLGVNTPADAIALNELQSEAVGNDLLLTGRPNYASAAQRKLEVAGSARRR